MAGDYRVVCPDIVGRGRSDWLRNKSLYAIPQYCADIATLLAKIGAESVDWVGTSMGGLIGMALAIQPETPIRKLVLNDVGPVITAASLERIGMYLGRASRFDSIEQIESAVRFVSQPFGTLTDAQWRHLTVHVTRQAADGKFEFAYDPGIAEPFKEVYAACGGKDVESWPLYDAIACPTLLLRRRHHAEIVAHRSQQMHRMSAVRDGLFLREHTGVSTSSKSRIKVFNFEHEGRKVPYTCTQCADAWCLNACPVDAIRIDAGHRRQGGARRTSCVGCKVCTIACPFGTVNYMADVGKVQKCDLCGGDPACADACPTGAITYVDADWTGLDKMRAWAAKTNTNCRAA
jgi:carbon-monoxide dehydrogenase iron sulfur subunit